MPQRPLRQCIGCQRLHRSSGYCPACRLHRDRKRRAERGERATFYSSRRWRKLREHKLQLDPLCEICEAVATEVHHVADVATAPALRYVLENLQSLCKSCHSRETMTRARERGDL